MCCHVRCDTSSFDMSEVDAAVDQTVKQWRDKVIARAKTPGFKLKGTTRAAQHREIGRVWKSFYEARQPVCWCF